ncbi:Homeodomain-interacting protein kinase 2 [Larimichthys crocea]|uniref:Homeodomain-interacting protein kinase 2 n=1 Tax=Larimichthys crocea TaxID=215358 RepID=A0A6G0I6U5_LARCR|nr:Homeodomain-interacting protein kinase 2 [Larimichthys crocea]
MEMNNTSNELQIHIGSSLGHFHKVEGFLGEGGFGFVTKCRNLQTNKSEAIKINKNSPEVVRQAKSEISILKRLQYLDPDTCNIVRWNGFFFDKDRICLNFELLDQSLYEYMTARNNKGLNMTELRPVIQQLATALSHLRSIGLVHADLKPDNVMIVNRNQHPLKVRLIDFGLAHPVAEVQPYICKQTTWYRAPEVMLNIPFNEAVDMWSLGITAAELATGYPLYPGNMDYDMLRFIIETQGQPADHVLDRGLGTGYYFHRDERSGQQRWTFKSPEAFASQTGFYAEETRAYKLNNLDALKHLVTKERQQSDQHLLVELIKRMLDLDPDQRINPLEVLRHPFFHYNVSQSSSADPCINTMGNKQEAPEDRQQPSRLQVRGPENLHLTPADLMDNTKNTDNTENIENTLKVQPDIDVENEGWVWRFFSRMKNTIQGYITWNRTAAIWSQPVADAP